ncbi:formiminoglutamate deiminase [Phenylobacterium zucineum HLK1]|uniref:Formiminoglutamate deiminase n=1 Tax=Phenylobacterium zucineum (strain HLK1) TaxID=450851 RepID=B4RED6_PHEZH|nr:formimidoylglutamate deiminase [Phenylobacterium zucineum]ACG76878.1 formiminoglutamate deiminase [Phenylobacterium zucineum HLK1]
MIAKARSLWFEQALLPGGWARRVRLSLDGCRIAAVERDVPQGPDDEAHGAALPGLCNLHSHAFQRGMAGMAEVAGPAGDNFWTWREAMYLFVDRLTPQDSQAIAELAYAEMLETGFTRVGEFHYLHNDPEGRPYADPAEMAQGIAAAAQATGIGLTLLPVFYAHANFGGAPPAPGQRRFIHDLDGFARLVEASRAAVAGLSDALVGVAPHSLRAVTPDELAVVARLGDGPVHIHAAEQVKEVEDCLAWSGARPVEWLLANAPVDARWCLVHATHMTADETRALAASGAVAGLCPVTEANLGDGVFPARDYLAAGGSFGVGTDSNVLIDAAAELRGLEYAQRLVTRSRNVAAPGPGRSTGAALFDATLAGGARALGVEAGLREGAAADIVALDLSHPSLAGRTGEALLDGWIFACRDNPVAAVWRRGRLVVSEGRHVCRGAIEARYREVLARIAG